MSAQKRSKTIQINNIHMWKCQLSSSLEHTRDMSKVSAEAAKPCKNKCKREWDNSMYMLSQNYPKQLSRRVVRTWTICRTNRTQWIFNWLRRVFSLFYLNPRSDSFTSKCFIHLNSFISIFVRMCLHNFLFRRWQDFKTFVAYICVFR